jgi:hypothetical protein
MLGLFISASGNVSIIEADEDFRLPPSLAFDPHKGRVPHELVAVDVVVFNCEESEWFDDRDGDVIALYEQVEPMPWAKGVRPVPLECQESEQRSES